MADPTRTTCFRFWLWLIALIGVIVPRRLRADWKQEWEAELQHREHLLDEWDRLTWRTKLDLLWRSVGAFWDALLLQPRRLEDEMFQDLRYGVRMLLKHPGFTAVAVLTLALGIGANSAIFSVVNDVLLKPFSFAEPEQLVVAWERCLNRGLPRMVVSPPNFADWRAQNQSFQDVAAYRPQDFNLIGSGEPERLRGLRVSATMFSMLGVRPALGRDFQPDEDQPGSPAAVVISDGFWQRRFGASPAVIGQSITLGSQNATIIGVMPPGFDFPPPITFRGEARPVKVELWTQLRYALEQDQRGAHNLFVLARLKDGISPARAEARSAKRHAASGQRLPGY